MKKELPDGFTVFWRIRNLDLISFNVENVDLPNPIAPEKVSFQLGPEVNLTAEKKEVVINLTVSIYSDESRKILLGSIKTRDEFEIQNFQEILNLNNNKFPPNLVAALIGVTISTTRGMLIFLSKNTPFEKAILPIIDPAIFFKPPSE